MYIHGHFINKQGATITVHIVTNADRSEEIKIGDKAAGLFFTGNPVEISGEINNTFDTLLKCSATVRFLASGFMSEFFRVSCRDAVINIYRNSVCLFAGFIEPQAYSQPYNELYDEIEINCIDALAALQYSKYRGVGGAGNLYNIIKASAGQRTFYEILVETLNGITNGLDLVGGASIRYLFEGSKAIDIDEKNRYTIFKQLSISELLFLGEDEDDTWQADEVIGEILKYLNLHLVQEGFTFYIFDWNTVKASSEGPIAWRNIVNGQVATTVKKKVLFETDNVADCNTAISIGEVYNQLLLTCKIEEVENVIESPLDEDLLLHPYTNMQKYCTEYSSDGEGITAYKAFKALTHGQSTTYGGSSVVDWFIRVRKSGSWIFPKNGNPATDLITLFCKDNKTQHALPNWLGANPGAAIIALGSVETNMAKADNSPTSKVNMTNYLVVSINGNGKDGENECYPKASDIKANIPYAVYTGNKAGGVFSPSDENITNYIVLSGKIILNPLMSMTDTYKDLHDLEWGRNYVKNGKLYTNWPWHLTVPSRTNEDGRYYTRQYWKSETPKMREEWDRDTDFGLVPFTGKGPELYEFKYSAIGDGTDTVSKVAVLACMLIVGDKCVVEKGTDGQISDFEWRTYKILEECSSEDEYYQQSFTIGFDPKLGDKLIGTEFNLQNNIDYTMGLDAEGIAIPVRKSDRVSGQIKFMILGPVNTIWAEITRRHPTFFRSTKWSSDSKPLLSQVSNIMVKQFEAKVYSDNGLINNKNDCDLIYLSDTDEEFTNKKDDIEFKINSSLTVSECESLGIMNTINLSTPLNTQTREGVLEICDCTRNKKVLAKPERHYVESYYEEYHLPRILLEQSIIDTDKNKEAGLFNCYVHPALGGKTFFVQGITRNLMESYARLNLKENNYA